MFSDRYTMYFHSPSRNWLQGRKKNTPECSIWKQTSQKMLVFCHWDKVSVIHNLRGDEFILDNGFRGFSTWLAGFKAEMDGRRTWQRTVAQPMAGRKQRTRKMQGTKYTIPRHNPNDPAL